MTSPRRVHPRPARRAPATGVYSLVARLTVAAVSLITAGCSFGSPPPDKAGEPPSFPTPSAPQSQANAPTGPALSVIAKNLRIPWGIAFLPDGAALVTERETRRIVRLGPEGGPDGLKVTPVQTINEAQARGEGGLMGIAVSPNYAADQTIFIYYTTSTDNRIAKLTLGGRPQPIVTGIPAAGNHNGGRLAFGPDGFLYATTGERGDPPLAQELSNLGGKILRMTPDGKPAPGNPFPSSLIWSYGHRNVQGLDWDSSKRLYAAEFGASTWDEINLIEPGKNYGWPIVEGMGTDSRFPNPIVVKRTNEASWSGMAIVGNTIVAAALRGERLWMVELTGNGTALGAPREALSGEYGRLRTAIRAPDGALWIATSNHDGRGRRIAPDDDRVLRLVLSGSSTSKS